MIVYAVLTDPIPIEVPYDSWEDIPEDAFSDFDRMALDELRKEVVINDWIPFRFYENEGDALDRCVFGVGEHDRL